MAAAVGSLIIRSTVRPANSPARFVALRRSSLKYAGTLITGAEKLPYEIDITEITGFDNLHHAEGILLEAQKRVAKLYHADKSFYLINGSTAGLLSAISACTSDGGSILMARNCHKAAYHAVYLRRLHAHYLYPAVFEETELNGGITPKAVEEALRVYPEIEAVLITSPSYDGMVSDIAAISEIVHAHQIPLGGRLSHDKTEK